MLRRHRATDISLADRGSRRSQRPIPPRLCRGRPVEDSHHDTEQKFTRRHTHRAPEQRDARFEQRIRDAHYTRVHVLSEGGGFSAEAGSGARPI